LERRTNWKFLMGDDGLWFWRAMHPDGTEQSSESTFATLRECTGDAMEQGYRAWNPDEDRRNKPPE
jgi:hypothetical protein